jgi:hypothetical protein
MKRKYIDITKIPKSHRLYKCDQAGCDIKVKTNCALQDHKWKVHDVPSLTSHRLYKCDQAKCDIKVKTNGGLKRHLEFVHDIGDHLCSFCASFRNSSNEYIEQKTESKTFICNRCYHKVTGKKHESRRYGVTTWTVH